MVSQSLKTMTNDSKGAVANYSSAHLADLLAEGMGVRGGRSLGDDQHPRHLPSASNCSEKVFEGTKTGKWRSTMQTEKRLKKNGQANYN
uniref:Uncharacterized protein n=1 Tax=Knipowitschia caucasica TaxID=637954 RepID=A0AAV2MJH5_KNICA